ncbi:MAG TPA: carboxyl transferase domain-containing protein [Bacteroidales bacterium]|nr:carboxyl transferase domain-containing protein [Bacteroidales bacterium]
MDVLKSNIKTGNEQFRIRRESYESSVAELRQYIRKYTRGGDPERIRNHTSKGKLTARQRIDLLVDTSGAFLELSPLAAFGQYEDKFPGAGIVTGIGIIHGRETVIIANDATIKGGTYVAETIKKHLRAQEIALENNLPCIYLVDSGGIYLPEQARVFADKNDFGRIFYNQSVLSAAAIPQVAVVLGSCTAGGAYIPVMCEETIIVRNQGTIFLGGPPLVSAAIGEEISAEELGGAAVHTGISGVADHLAVNDEHALHICRNIFETLHRPEKQSNLQATPEEPLYDPHELYGLLPQSVRENPDPREIIARIVDGSRFQEFKTEYGQTLVTGFARIMGYTVGILANHGVIHASSALKGTHFIELCNYRKIPMVFLQHITGFMVGREAEHNGIARDGAKMVHAVATSVVPKFTIITGGSFGAGNYAMSGRAFNPRLLFMLPGARISVMGAEQAAHVLVTIGEKHNNGSAAVLQAETKRSTIFETYEKQGSPYYSTSRLWDDGIIDPVDIRKVLGLGIAMSMNKKFADPENGIYRM